MRSIRLTTGTHVRCIVLLTGLGLLSLQACEVPEAPQWDVGVIAPFSSDPLSIVDFLPSSVDTATIDGEAVFTVETQEDSVVYTLGQMCSACGSLHGTTALVPAFDYADSLDVRFDADLVQIEILSARLGTRVHNRLNFDPLRPDPDPAAAGWVAIAVRDIGSGALLDSVFISGATETLPADSTREIELALSDVTITEGLRSVFYIHSPQDGQVVQIDTTMGASVTSFVDELRVAAITAVVASDTLEETLIIDFDDELRSEISERVQSGAYELTLRHDLEIAGDLELSIAGSAGDLFSGDPNREVRLPGLTLEPDVLQTGELSPVEIEQIAGYPEVLVGYRGLANGLRTGPGSFTSLSRFTPDQLLGTQLKLSARVRVGD